MSETGHKESGPLASGDKNADHRFFRFIFGFSAGAAVIVVAAYAAMFGNLEFGGPDAWSSFGNYFSGMLTPIIALVSVFVLCRTLIVQQREFRKSVKALDDTAKINSENLTQQRRFFRLQELVGSLDSLKDSIKKHEITFLLNDSVNARDAVLFGVTGPATYSNLKNLPLVLDMEEIQRIKNEIGERGCQEIFTENIDRLMDKVEHIITYLELGGLRILVDDEVELLHRSFTVLRIFAKEVGYIDVADRLNEAKIRLEDSHIINTKRYRNELKGVNL